MVDPLPMFPLNTVLFPGVTVPLTVFEDRYRAMVHHLLRVEGRLAARDAVELDEVMVGALRFDEDGAVRCFVAADALLAVAVVPVAAQLDLKRFAGCVDAKRAVLAPARDAERATGYVLGAISPIGQKRSLPTVVDHSVAALDSVFVSGGRRGLEIELAMEDLVRLTGARIAPIARGAG